jgi:drug/metabolite transporter (DMT)-like permease
LRLPLFAVQAIAASSIGVVVVLSSMRSRTRPATRQLVVLGVLAVGLVALAATASPDRPTAAPAWFAVAAWIGVVLIAGSGVVVARTVTGDRAGAVLGGLSGLAFGGAALCARAVEAHRQLSAIVRDPLSWALLVFGALGIALYAAALQRGSVTIATACQYALETLVPAVIGLAVLGDRARPGWAGVAVIGFALTLGAAILLTFDSPVGSEGVGPPVVPLTGGSTPSRGPASPR